MNKIIEKEYFSEVVVKLVLEAPAIAKSRRAGHFVIVRTGEKGEPPLPLLPLIPTGEPLLSLSRGWE